ncbi:MAG: TolC family protein [Candidatus Merdousia sp.]|nr:TolC family protein [Candidatus Merdousia sp.]
MKNKILAFSAVSAAAFACGCVNVDREVAETPSVYWKAPKDAMPSEYYKPSQIKTDKIEKSEDATEKAQKGGEAASDGAQKAAPRNLTPSEKLLAGGELTLPELIDIALENNPTTRMYWFQAKQYAAAQGKAEASYYPQVSVGAQVYRDKTKISEASLVPIGAYYETAYGPSAQISWLLFDFGKREAQVESAREALRAANFEYNQALQDVFLNVNVAFFRYYAALGSVKAAQLDVEDSKTSYESADRKLRDGVGNKQDMLNALASLRTAEFTLESKKSDVETARANLANAMGVNAADLRNISENVNIPTASEKRIDELVAQAMRSRQSLLAGYAKLRKTQSDVKTAKRDFLPQLNAQGSASYMWDTESQREDAYQYQFGLAASWSIFEGFARKYELISAKAAERAQAQQLKAEEISIISDIWAYYHVYQSSLKQIASSEASVEAASEAYEATKIGFANGVNSITDLLNAQTRLASARQSNVNARSSLAIAVARLSHAVGAVSANGI